MKAVDEIRAALAQCYGSENWYKMGFLFPRMYLTDGAKTVADMCEAHWLMAAIASHQPSCLKDDMLKEVQFWTFKKKGEGWVLICERDSGNVFFTQDIDFSDFPFPEGIKLYVKPLDEKNYTIMLPSEN